MPRVVQQREWNREDQCKYSDGGSSQGQHSDKHPGGNAERAEAARPLNQQDGEQGSDSERDGVGDEKERQIFERIAAGQAPGSNRQGWDTHDRDERPG